MKDKSSESFYAGKKVAYIYKADKAKSGSKLRAVWGKLTRAHGSNGLFRAKFKRNLAVSDAFYFLVIVFLIYFCTQTTAAGAAVRVFLYPSRV